MSDAVFFFVGGVLVGIGGGIIIGLWLTCVVRDAGIRAAKEYDLRRTQLNMRHIPCGKMR